MTTDPGSSGFDREKVERLDHRASVLAPVTLGMIFGLLLLTFGSAKDSALRVPIVRQLTDMGRDALALARVRPSSGQQGGLICSVSAFTIEPPTLVS